MISSLLMTGTVAPRNALPDARGPLSFLLSSSNTQQPLLIPPSVQSNDCPLHAPYHPVLSVFLSLCGRLWILKHGVETRCWQSHRVSEGSVCCKAATLLTSHPTSMYCNCYEYLYQVLRSSVKTFPRAHTLPLGYGLANKSAISSVPEALRGSEVR